jgi:hypothetical protein
MMKKYFCMTSENEMQNGWNHQDIVALQKHQKRHADA